MSTFTLLLVLIVTLSTITAIGGDALVSSGLAASGYRYVNIDSGWRKDEQTCEVPECFTTGSR